MLNLVISLKKIKNFSRRLGNGIREIFQKKFFGDVYATWKSQKNFKKNFSKRQPDPVIRCIRGVVHPYTTSPQR